MVATEQGFTPSTVAVTRTMPRLRPRWSTRASKRGVAPSGIGLG
jgi:hypothetical protein